ncbi:MAG: cation diffusion facilitator family transporter [Xenococcaceae cyanobacterium MO_188.B29]|nr:cation diffusion facilitator family transporter [Xenococcaceae cyanobacterium MO_188.B29]
MENYKHHSNSELQKRQDSIQQVLYITLGLNLIVLETKFCLGLATGSLSLLADALHSFTDSASNVVGLIAMRLANPKPDWDHPYGHSKFESLGALAIAGFLIVTCLEILRSAVERIFATQGTESLTVDNLDLLLMIGVLIINIGVAIYEKNRGKALRSTLLLADARHTLSDVWVTIAILIGLVGVQQGWLWLDTILTFVVAGFIFHSAWEVLQENIPSLTDRVAIPAKDILEVTMGVYGVLNCHSITSRGKLEHEIFIEMHMVVAPQDIKTAHAVTEEVERKLQEKYGLVHVTIHLEPYEYIEPLESHLQKPQIN